MEKIDQILDSLYDRVIEPIEAKEQLLDLFAVSFNDEGVEVCKHEYKHEHTNWYKCTKCGYVTAM